MTKLEFLDGVVFGWMKRDLERMRDEIQVKPNDAGNINFPLALCTLAYVEYLGGFILGDKGDFTLNVGTYINSCFLNPGEYPVDVLRDIFRNGVAHNYFPRGGISRDGERPAVYKIHSMGIALDAQTLVNDFFYSLNKFRRVLNETNFTVRMQQAENDLKTMQARYQNIFNNLPERIILPKIVTSTASDASGPAGPMASTTTLDPNIH